MTQPRDDAGRFAGRDVNYLHLRPGETIAGASMNDEIRLAAGGEVAFDSDAPPTSEPPASSGGNFGGGQEGAMTGAGYEKPEKSFGQVLRDAIDASRGAP